MRQQRGRKSAEAKATLTAIVDRRPAPPSDLPPYAAEVWREVAGAMAHEVDKLIAEFLESDDNELRKQIPALLKARERESRAMLALARSMRLTHQAQYGPRTAERKSGNGGKPLWER